MGDNGQEWLTLVPFYSDPFYFLKIEQTDTSLKMYIASFSHVIPPELVSQSMT